MPAGGQGAVGIEIRIDDSSTRKLIEPLHHRLTAEQVFAERAVNKRLDGGCQVPIGSFAQHKGNLLMLTALVAEPDGTKIIKEVMTSVPERGEQMGIEIAEKILQRGGDKILQKLYDKNS